jgi:3-oxoacyl-(acyl-carrier-protein) synthase
MINRVVITGLGAISSLGMTASSQYQNACSAISGIKFLNLVSGVPVDTNIAAFIAQDIPHQLDFSSLSLYDRVSQMSWAAASQAIEDSGIEKIFSDDISAKSGVYWGTGFGGSSTIEKSYDDLFLQGKKRVRPFTVMGVMANGPAALISMQAEFRGPSITYSTACSSSAHAIGEAYRQIKNGYCERAIAGGAEALLQSGPIKAWEALKTLAQVDLQNPANSCKPFSLDRTGFVLGEGAAALFLETYKSAKARNAKILAEIVGYGVSSDASHITKPDFLGQSKAMEYAIKDAHLVPSDIAYINAHGTATEVGDISETNAIKNVFKDYAKKLCISSTKAVHGHTFGAAGALELLITVQAQINNCAPPTAFLEKPDPQCDLNYLPLNSKKMEIKYAMSNSFGFGGTNVSLITKV